MEYRCATCGAEACFGFSGIWFCAAHQDRFIVPLPPVRPTITIPDDIARASLAEIQDELRKGLDQDRRAALWLQLDKLTKGHP